MQWDYIFSAKETYQERMPELRLLWKSNLKTKIEIGVAFLVSKGTYSRGSFKEEGKRIWTTKKGVSRRYHTILGI